MFDFIYVWIGKLISLFNGWTGNYILALLIFAVFAKVIFIPLDIKQQKNSIKQASTEHAVPFALVEGLYLFLHLHLGSSVGASLVFVSDNHLLGTELGLLNAVFLLFDVERKEYHLSENSKEEQSNDVVASPTVKEG